MIREAFADAGRRLKRIHWPSTNTLQEVGAGCLLVLVIALVCGGLLWLSSTDDANWEHDEAVKKQKAYDGVTKLCGPDAGQKFKVYIKATDGYAPDEAGDWMKDCLRGRPR